MKTLTEDAPAIATPAPAQVNTDLLQLTDAEAARFWAKVDKSAGPDDCWLWTGAKIDTGHGVVKYRGVQTQAYRLSFRIHKGSIPDGLCVCHHCDNPPCVNPSHLYSGTHGQNIKDRDDRQRTAKGMRHGRNTMPERTARGEGHGRATLNKNLVRAMRRDREQGLSYSAIAKKRGVSRGAAWCAIAGPSWKHVP